MNVVSSAQLRERVLRELATYRYEVPEPGSTVGTPWSSEQVAACLEARRAILVEPYRSLLHFCEGDRRWREGPHALSDDVWIIAKDGEYFVFFDPMSEQFGLAAEQANSNVPSFWGVAGDLVYVLCVM